ncbi:MAG: hypothetical protein ACYTFM_06800 [Planctomycetota bacterium]
MKIKYTDMTITIDGLNIIGIEKTIHMKEPIATAKLQVIIA